MSKLLEAYTELNEAKDRIRDLEVQLLVAKTHNEQMEKTIHSLMRIISEDQPSVPSGTL